MENKMTSYFVKQGLIFGLVNIVLVMLIYLMGADFFASHFIMIPIFLVIIAIVYPIIITIRYRKINGGFLSFKDAFKISFFMMVISGAITAVFGIILYHVIDTEYPQLIQTKMTEKMTEYLTSLNVPESKIQESLDQNNIAEKFTIKGQVKSFFFSIVFYAVFSLIVALIAKKKEQDPFGSQVL